jgi:hypothetical protein
MFAEEQGFPLGFILAVSALLVVICLVPLAFFAVNDRLRVPSVVISFIVPALIIGFLVDFKLRISATSDSIAVSFGRFSKKSFSLDDVSKVEKVTYSPIMDFGGWGIRYGLGGKIYSARGTQAVKLTLKSGSILYLGTERPDDLVNVFKKA